MRLLATTSRRTHKFMGTTTATDITVAGADALQTSFPSAAARTPTERQADEFVRQQGGCLHEWPSAVGQVVQQSGRGYLGARPCHTGIAIGLAVAAVALLGGSTLRRRRS